jgi:hypothetical protein
MCGYVCVYVYSIFNFLKNKTSKIEKSYFKINQKIQKKEFQKENKNFKIMKF